MHLLELALPDTGAVGLAAAAVRGEELLYAGGVGMANLESGAPVDADTVELVRSDTPRALAALEDLGELLRHGLYEGGERTVAAGREAELAGRFLALEALRRERFMHAVRVTGTAAQRRVAPFLLMALVENAVKHGAHGTPASGVDVDIDVTADGALRLRVANALPEAVPGTVAGTSPEADAGATSGGSGLAPSRAVASGSSGSRPFARAIPSPGGPPGRHVGGVGLANLDRRLSLLYPDRHARHVSRKASVHTVTLVLEGLPLPTPDRDGRR